MCRRAIRGTSEPSPKQMCCRVMHSGSVVSMDTRPPHAARSVPDATDRSPRVGLGDSLVIGNGTKAAISPSWKCAQPQQRYAGAARSSSCLRTHLVRFTDDHASPAVLVKACSSSHALNAVARQVSAILLSWLNMPLFRVHRHRP